MASVIYRAATARLWQFWGLTAAANTPQAICDRCISIPKMKNYCPNYHPVIDIGGTSPSTPLGIARLWMGALQSCYVFIFITVYVISDTVSMKQNHDVQNILLGVSVLCLIKFNTVTDYNPMVIQ